MKTLEKSYPACRALLGPGLWAKVNALCSGGSEPFHSCLAEKADELSLPPFLPDLALLEAAAARAQEANAPPPGEDGEFLANPGLEIHQVQWRGLGSLVKGEGGTAPVNPVKGEELIMVWYDRLGEKVRAEPPGDLDLLALKVVVENADVREVAAEAGRHPGIIDVALWSAARKGILVPPPSRIRRDPSAWPAAQSVDEKYLVSQGFTLQWHITQACDLHCRHCYDRSSRKAIPLDRALAVLDELREFCRGRSVSGHVTFTGGNPLLHPHFIDLYRGASERGFTLSVLGNPASREALEQIVAVEVPTVYQVSLEGLEEHNDAVRGEGHFKRVVEFLPLLRELGIPSMVMLTLTDENIDQVLPLALRLEGIVDDFFFNRLSAVGEGADLHLPTRDKYEAFLGEYLDEARKRPHLGLKDNLFNILLQRRGEPLFGGCTGFGCGAAFNFLTLLPEGEAHGCRKFPSPIGNVLEQGLEGVYDSEAARRYRDGCAACRDCSLRPLCGGCLAVAYSQGRDPCREKDPHCFIEQAK